MHDTAWRPHPPFEEELPPGYSWCSYPDTAVVAFPDDDAAVLFPLPVSDGATKGYLGPVGPAGHDRDREPLSEPLPAPAEPQRLCVVIGTPGAGKTSLGATWARQPSGSDPTPGVASVVQGDGLQAWSDDAEAAFGHTGRRATARLREGALRVHTERGEPQHWTLREPHADAVFANTAAPRGTKPSGLFASPPSAPGQAWTSVALVLCIDGERPQRELWQRVLPRQLEAWSAAAASEPALGGGSTGQAPFDRVLVLLTKADRFCAQARSAAHLGRGRAQKAIAGMKPDDIAKRLDPAHQVRAVIGDGLLEQLLGSLKPGATMAAGLVSTFGFGAPLPGTASALPPWRSAAWQPFGVRAAFSYLDGAAPSFPLAALDREALRRELVTIAQ